MQQLHCSFHSICNSYTVPFTLYATVTLFLSLYMQQLHCSFHSICNSYTVPFTLYATVTLFLSLYMPRSVTRTVCCIQSPQTLIPTPTTTAITAVQFLCVAGGGGGLRGSSEYRGVVVTPHMSRGWLSPTALGGGVNHRVHRELLNTYSNTTIQPLCAADSSCCCHSDTPLLQALPLLYSSEISVLPRIFICRILIEQNA